MHNLHVDAVSSDVPDLFCYIIIFNKLCWRQLYGTHYILFIPKDKIHAVFLHEISEATPKENTCLLLLPFQKFSITAVLPF